MDIELKVKVKARKVNSITDIKKNDRLAYELGYYKEGGDKTINYHQPEYWTPTGVFKEIGNVEEFLSREKDRLKDERYLKHHNFVVVENIL
jgi:hypothetical protein